MTVHISALYTYPIKSCGGIAHDRVDLAARGLHDDRRWMVTDPAGRFITMREIHRMALIQPTISEDEMILTAPDLPPLHIPLAGENGQRREVVVWRSTCVGVDEGDAAADWFSRATGVPARLVKMADDHQRLTATDYTDTPGEVGFADGYPVLFISEASLADLNDRLVARGKSPVPMARFRPNVVLSGGAAYAEDTWSQVEIGGVTFDVVKPCARCVMTTVDPATATQPDAAEPLATLATYRRTEKGAMFGQNVIHRGLGTLSVGDTVQMVAPRLTER